MPAIISIHDATAESLADVAAIADLLSSAGCCSADILVVCGSNWSPRDIDVLRGLEERGFRLQGHGWSHRAGPRRNWFHRLHSWTLSRDVAEHLSKPAEEIRALIARSYDWFGRHLLQPPSMYVPPAWAMGALGRDALRTLPYRYYETITGIYDAHADRFRRLPLIGFEADTWLRAGFLRCFNGANRMSGWVTGRPIRLSIHPQDLRLRLRRALTTAIQTAGPQRLCDFRSVIESPGADIDATKDTDPVQQRLRVG
jgi:predicted deacetylase